MVKFFLTGDNHFGLNYSGYGDKGEVITEGQMEAFQRMVDKANETDCDFFVIAGDLFDKQSGILKKMMDRIVDILRGFNNTVLILPGNHDFYTENSKLWSGFEKCIDGNATNIVILNEFRPYSYDIRGEKVVFYPAYCDSKTKDENNLGWMKDAAGAGGIDTEGAINVGIIHGAIQGLSLDKEGRYFYMSDQELRSIPMDIWLAGHAHVPYPASLETDKDTFGYRIFNAGSHQQPDISRQTEGNGFIISVDKKDGASEVFARKFVSGEIRFVEISVDVKPDSDTALEEALRTALEGASIIDPSKTIVYVNLTGSVREAEYNDRINICRNILADYLYYKPASLSELTSNLTEKISIEKIRSEYAETSFAAKLLEELIGDPMELQMAYDLMKNIKQ